jgi:hypothetical protein
MRSTLRTLPGLVLISILVHSAAAQTDDAAKAQKLVDRAIKAMGGDKAINKTSIAIVEDAGTYYGMGEGVPYTGRYVYDLKNRRYRVEIVGFFVSVIDKDKGWTSAMGNVTDLEGDALTNGKEGVLVNYAMSLIPLQKPNRKFKLSLAGEDEVDGEKCDGINIDHDNMPTVTLFFSRKSGLIKKSRYKTRSAEEGFKEVTDETVYHKYKKFDGVQNPVSMTMNRDGKKFIESRPAKVSYPDSVDEKEFKKPE